MDGILSSFSFSRKKKAGARDGDKLEISHVDGGSSAGSDAMRLTKNNPAPDFDDDDISDFGFSGIGSQDANQATDASRSQPTAVIGPKITFKGELSGEEDLLIQGTVEGTINLTGMHLTIGRQGVIKANVSAKTITVEGKVEGDITASDHIAVKNGSKIQGNMKAERVTLEDGAKFRGAIDMDMEAKVAVKSPSVSATTPTKPFSHESPLDIPLEKK